MADKEKILKALSKLDHSDSSMWTDDGLPITKVVQQLADDSTIKRSDITEASPGFERKLVSTETGPAPEVAATADVTEPMTEGDGEPMTEDEVREVLAQRVTAAELTLRDARTAVSAAYDAERAAVSKVTEARKEQASAFPPITAAANIQQHLKRQQAIRAALAAGQAPGQAPASQVDAAMTRGNSRGWKRPSRTAEHYLRGTTVAPKVPIAPAAPAAAARA